MQSGDPLHVILTRALDLLERFIVVEEAKHSPEYLKRVRKDMRKED